MNRRTFIAVTSYAGLGTILPAQEDQLFSAAPAGFEGLLQARRSMLSVQLQTSSLDRASRSGVANDKVLSALTLMCEKALADYSGKEQISVTEREALSFVVPNLISQGLIGSPENWSLDSDQNFKTYLDAQGWSVDDFKTFAKNLLTWARVCSKKNQATADEVKTYLKDNPGLAQIPQRVKLQIDSLQAPQSMKSRSRAVPKIELLGGYFANARAAGALGAVDDARSKKWESIEMYLPLDRMDDQLRSDLSGKVPGNSFGPLRLSNGVMVEGKITGIIPPFTVTDKQSLWEYASILASLAKSDQKAVFDQLQKDAFGSDLVAKGFLSGLLTVAGGAVGSLFGAPALGATIGGAVGGWIDRKDARPAPSPQFNPATWGTAVQQIAQGFSNSTPFGPAIANFANAFIPPQLPPSPIPPPSAGYPGFWQIPPAFFNQTPRWVPPFAMPIGLRFF